MFYLPSTTPNSSYHSNFDIDNQITPLNNIESYLETLEKLKAIPEREVKLNHDTPGQGNYHSRLLSLKDTR